MLLLLPQLWLMILLGAPRQNPKPVKAPSEQKKLEA